MNGKSCGCGCCEGIRKLTPAVPENRAGLGALRYRVGTHARFLETMKARLSTLELTTKDFDELPPDAIRQPRPLLSLTTRDASDPAIALLDAWALVADVLTFYQERIANEGYLGTAVERRSVIELARLIGYRPRPGVAASVYLAYTLEKAARVLIPAGSRAQTVPGPGELPQSFETSADLDARDEWNVLRPRLSRPQTITSSQATGTAELYFKGTATKLKAGDPLLLVFPAPGGGAPAATVRRVQTVEPQTAADRTRVTLVPMNSSLVAMLKTQAIAERHSDIESFAVSGRSALAREVLARLGELRQLSEGQLDTELSRILGELRASHRIASERGFPRLEPWLAGMIGDLEEVQRELITSDAPAMVKTGNDDPFVTALELAPSVPPRNALRLTRNTAEAFSAGSDAPLRLLTVLRPALGPLLYHALGGIVIDPPEVEVYAFRVAAPLFGYNATATRPRVVGDLRPLGEDEWHVVDPIYHTTSLTNLTTTIIGATVYEEPGVVNLDAAYESILPGSWVVVETAQTPLTAAAMLIGIAGSVRAGIGRGAYGVSGKTTRIELLKADGSGQSLPWITQPLTLPPNATAAIAGDFAAIRSTQVFAQSERLELAERPIDPVQEPIGEDRIELAALSGELEPGRWIIVTGERVDIPHVAGVYATELAMIARVDHGDANSGIFTHSTLILAKALAYRYKRDTVTIYGNVMDATHGETHAEAVGSGDAGEAMQAMDLRQKPLTYLAAPTPEGAQSTLQLRVDDVLWHEAETLLGAGAKDRLYVTRTGDDDVTTVVFGDGKSGSRLPTGHENVKAVYRTGIGAAGNAKAGQISLLATRPLGVKSVVNPLPATGGANREDHDQVQRNAPLAVAALDRLVSVRDYEDFARTFAGIAKASAALISDGRRQLVHVTVAGSDDIPIAESSDLFINLRQALRAFGDPAQPLRLATRKLNALFISAKVRLAPDYEWESVEPKIRAALLDAFGFARRALGQDALPSEALSAIQAQPGVAWVDLDIFDSVNESVDPSQLGGIGATLTLRDRVRAPKARRDKSAQGLVVKPAELAFLTPALADTLILTELTR